jgi:hypothetical protein
MYKIFPALLAVLCSVPNGKRSFEAFAALTASLKSMATMLFDQPLHRNSCSSLALWTENEEKERETAIQRLIKPLWWMGWSGFLEAHFGEAGIGELCWHS